MFNGVILEVGTIRRIICFSFLLLLFIINSILGSESDNLFNDDSQGDFKNLAISAALTNAVEDNDWRGLAKNIDSIIKTVGIEELVDSVKEVYEEFCTPMLVEKIVGDFCNGLGVICFETGFSKEAIDCFEIACSICQKYENKQGVYANLINQAFVYLECSDTVVALERVSEVYASLIESDNLESWEMEKCLELLSGTNRINEGIEKVEPVFIPSGLLSYLPFHTLARESKEGFNFIIEEKNISYLTSAELIDIARGNAKKRKPKSLLAFDNADGSLPEAAEEVESIKAIFPKSSVFTLNDATEGKAIGLSQDYNILHFATHVRLNVYEPLESYIVLSKESMYDGNWYINEILGIEWEKMHLVVLSACETALGEEEPGREVATMAWAFSVADTPSVIASLWPVYDSSTKTLR